MPLIFQSKHTNSSSQKPEFPREEWCEPLFWKAIPYHALANDDNKIGTKNYFFQQRKIK